MGSFWWNKLKYTYFLFLCWCWVKLTPRLCWLLQWWNYCCVIALDGLACAEFKEFDEHKIELNLTWPMVKSNADRCTFNISTLQLKFDHQKGCLSLSWSPSSDTMFYLWVVGEQLNIFWMVEQLNVFWMVEQLTIFCTFWMVEQLNVFYILNRASAYSPLWCYSFNLSPCIFIYKEDKVLCCLVWNIYF